MRAIPGIVVISPCDAAETGSVMEAIIKYKGPCYIRLCRVAGPVIFNDNYKFEIGKGIKLFEGKKPKATIVSAGFTTYIALNAAKKMELEGLEVELINMASIKPLDDNLLIESAGKTNLVITVEDHSIIGGLGSAVCEALAEKLPTKVIRLGVKDKFGSSGTPSELISAYGFDESSIIKAVKENLN
jgi:transketolase